jgi:hypothetical protein
MEKINSMTEEEFSQAALEKGFDEQWIKSCIEDSKKEIEETLREGRITPIPLETELALLYEHIVKHGPIENIY